MTQTDKKVKKKKTLLIAVCSAISCLGIVFSTVLIQKYMLPPEPIQKVIQKNYKYENEIPCAVYYSEYMDDGWWGGTLNYQDSKQLPTSGFFQVTFSGSLSKS